VNWINEVYAAPYKKRRAAQLRRSAWFRLTQGDQMWYRGG
jgi:hypothetical protein